jgi:VIT1/CCC1 family predicted Fe2+/Mn2+ transporter
MSRLKTHNEGHLLHRIGWLRAAVLRANDGIVTTASLLVGVVAASIGKGPAVVAGLAGLVAGAMSMAAGAYVSVSSQSDTERADIARERAELEADPEAERHELAAIYQARGLDETIALQVADQLMKQSAPICVDELGLSEFTTPHPLIAATH